MKRKILSKMSVLGVMLQTEHHFSGNSNLGQILINFKVN